jgi:DNA-directed RNA polymerase specialized sigma24 family protein
MSRLAQNEVHDVPGLALMRQGNDEGKRIFAEHYLPIITVFAFKAGLHRSNHWEFTSQDHAIEILGDFVVKPPEFFQGLDISDDKAMRGYLRKMVVNRGKDLVKRQYSKRTHESIVNEDGEDIIANEDVLTAAPIYRPLRQDFVVFLKELCDMVRACMRDLKPKAAQVIEMLGDQLPQREMALELNVNVKSMGIVVNRAKEQVRAKVCERCPELQSFRF